MNNILNDVSVIKRTMLVRGADEVQRIKSVNTDSIITIRSRNIIDDLYEVIIEYPKKKTWFEESAEHFKGDNKKANSINITANFDTRNLKNELDSLSTMLKKITDAIDEYITKEG